jgi:CubicO group peptidase (beta-lactamase class C family)
VTECTDRWTFAAADIETYLSAQVADASHREIIGPLHASTGASGVVWVHGEEVAKWGDADSPEMAFSVTKSVVSVVAGLAFDDGLLVPDQPVQEVVGIAEFEGSQRDLITWRHCCNRPASGRVSCGENRRGSMRRAFVRAPRYTGRLRARVGHTTTCG